MSSEIADASVTAGETPIPKYDFTYSRFGDEYDVHAGFLPFRSRERDRDRIEDLTTITEFLTSRPRYCQGTSMKQLTGRFLLDGRFNRCFADDLELLALLHGWWQTRHSASSGRLFANPEYVHRDELDYITDPDEREAVARQAASLGYVTPTQVGLMFGYDPDSKPYNTFSKWAHRHDLPWGELREAGRDRMCRTWKTIWKWGYIQSEIVDAFGVSEGIVYRGIKRVRDFEPPADPTQDGDGDA